MWLATALLLMFADPPPPADAAEKPAPTAEDQLKALQGQWIGSTPDGTETAWEIKDDTFKIDIAEMHFVGKIKLEPAAKPERRIDFKLSEPSEYNGKESLGIYKLEEDKLTVCVCMPDVPERPEEFKSIEGETFLYELKKKPKPKD